MRILAFDTHQGGCSVALCEHNKVIAQVKETEHAKQAERLLGMVEAVLKEANTSYNMLDALTVTTGPGSFTGVRIGLAAAHGIALACGVPLHGITSLAATAWEAYSNIPSPDKPILIALDARRGDVFLQAFTPDMNTLTSPGMQTVTSCTIENLPKDFYLAGSGAKLILPTLQQHGLHPNTIPNIELSASSLAGLVSYYCQHNCGIQPATPLYIRKPDAKLQKQWA